MRTALKREERPWQGARRRPETKQQKSTPRPPRRGPWPDAPLRRFAGWPEGLLTYLGGAA